MSAPSGARAPRPDYPASGEIVDEVVPLLDVVAVAGPPVMFLAVPWLLFGLMLAGPFAALVALTAVLVAAWVILALAGAVLATPYLLIRHFRGRRASHATISLSTPQPVRIGTPQVPA